LIEPHMKTSTSPAPAAQRDHRAAAGLALASALVALAGVGQTWLRIRIGGVSAPGSSQTGWAGRDGWTVAVAATGAAVAALGLLMGRREVWLRVALFISGATTLVITIVNLLGARNKANDIHDLYGIPPGDVKAQVGIGLVLLAFASVGILAGALISQRIEA
jgi:hypothetical protein